MVCAVVWDHKLGHKGVSNQKPSAIPQCTSQDTKGKKNKKKTPNLATVHNIECKYQILDYRGKNTKNKQRIHYLVCIPILFLV